jgi:hypothetical protein
MIEVCGVTAAIPASDLMKGSRAEVGAYLRDVYAHLERALREHTGNAKPQGQPSFQIDGPNDSDLLGVIYTASLGVPVEVNDLPLDCTAYEAHHQERKRVEGVIHVQAPKQVDP